METASFQAHKKTFSNIGVKENRITSTLTVFWNNDIPGFFYSQWIKWCQVLCLILPFLITLSKTCWHSLAWLRTNSAIQPDFRLHSDQTRSLCSSNSPEKNVHLKVQYQKTYFQQHSLSTFFQRRKSWRQGSGVAWSHNCWTGDNCINSKAVKICFQRVSMFIICF